MSLVPEFFSRAGLTSGGACIAWRPDLLLLQAVSDLLIGLACLSIPLALAAFMIRRHDFPCRWMFWLAAAFIFAYGSTHLFSVWTIWYPDWAWDGLVKALTAVIAVVTAVQFWVMLPIAVAWPSPAMLQMANGELETRVADLAIVAQALEVETAERVRAEAILARAQKLDAIGLLTGGIAHDFNNLLMVVMANLELLGKRTASDPSISKYVDRALGSARRGATLIQQLLAFARRQPLQPLRFDAGRLVEDTASLLRGILGRHIELSIEVDADLWRIEADPTQLESALFNLAINARDAMPDGGKVVISTRNLVIQPGGGSDAESIAGEYVVISVSDTGTGMTPEIRQSAFEPFFTTKPIGQGSGLGLSQVYGFIKQSSGHVQLHSEMGQGTTVILYLRRASELPAPAGSRPGIVEIAACGERPAAPASADPT